MKPLFFITLLVSFYIAVNGGSIHEIIKKCCFVGDEWAGKNTNCDGSPSLFNFVQGEDKVLCQSSFGICCLRSQRNNLCQTGKDTAKKNGECRVLPAVGGETHKDCCDACKLGISVGEQSEDCFFRDFSLSMPWDEPFYSCCTHAKSGIKGFVRNPIEAAQNRCISDNPCQVGHKCQDLGESVVRCSCNAGFKLSSNGFNCQDVDECREKLDACEENTEICLNTVGGYHCVPNEGNPSNRGNNVDPFDNRHQVLDNRQRCPPGMFYNTSSSFCDDVDECITGAHNCAVGFQVCTNTMGSFTCIGTIGNNPAKQCPAGYKPHPTKHCDDVDECLEGTHGCDPVREICVNNYGAYFCQARESQTCPAGYKWNDNENKCEDVDECAENLAECAEDIEQCENTVGGYTCNTNCDVGHVFDAVQSRCVDFDECADNENVCKRSESCINTLGSFKCVRENSIGVSCPGGYEADSRGNCQDLDECALGLHNCNAEAGEVCINDVGTFKCQSSRKGGNDKICLNGMKFDANSRRCIDVDECAENLHNCNPRTERCQNNVGSFQCIPKEVDHREPSVNSPCPRGFRRNSYTRRCEDLNECQLSIHNCGSSQRCDNTVGSFLCVRVTDCGTGYTLNAQTGLCEDNDECTLNPNTCSRDFICRNTEGSFRCDRLTCPDGERLLADGICHPINCAPGMELDTAGRCSDINECATTSPCRSNQRCVNTPGSYRCQSAITCGGGYESNTYGTDCVDTNECDKGTHECGLNQICKNRPGGYTCECPIGYSLNSGRVCEDVDECTRHRGVCSINSECQNTPGSYICHCKPGYRKSANSQNCEDIDECLESPNLCQHNCVNTWGSFQCTCKPGFLVGTDNRSCQDVDECDLYKDKGSLCIGFCVNKPGSYGCSCPEGYRLGGDTRTCQDINECLEEGVCSGEHQTCLNTRGGYKCYNLTCPPNYVKDNSHKNRCKRTDNQCHRGDDNCLKRPTSLSFNYLTMVSKMRMPSTGQLDLFTMRGPRFDFTNVIFEFEFKGARAPVGVEPATKGTFHLRRTHTNEVMLSMLKTLEGPQEIELEIDMMIYHHGQFAGKALAKIFIIVTRYEF